MWLAFLFVFFKVNAAKKSCTMTTILDIDGDCPHYILADRNISGSGALIVATPKPGAVNTNDHTIGVCLTNNKCEYGTRFTLERDTSGTIKMYDTGRSQLCSNTLLFYAESTDVFSAVDGNVLEIPTGKTFSLHLGGTTDANLGFLFDKSSMRIISLNIVMQSEASMTHVRKRRSVLKRVEVTTDDGETKTLNIENTMRTIVAWLDAMNKEHASTYSVDRLVWCEEQCNARSKGTVRGWFKCDVSDGNKRKGIPNASDAVVAMEQLTQTNFYMEMKDNFKAYNVDLVDQGSVSSGNGLTSGDKAEKGEGKVSSSVVYMSIQEDSD